MFNVHADADADAHTELWLYLHYDGIQTNWMRYASPFNWATHSMMRMEYFMAHTVPSHRRYKKKEDQSRKEKKNDNKAIECIQFKTKGDYGSQFSTQLQ